MTRETLRDLLRGSGADDAANAAAVGAANVRLSEAREAELADIYSVRQQIQQDAGRPRIADQMQALVRNLSADSSARAWTCLVTSAELGYLVVLSENRDAVLGVVTTPIRPDGSIADAP
jgi:hypothetical protein